MGCVHFRNSSRPFYALAVQTGKMEEREGVVRDVMHGASNLSMAVICSANIESMQVNRHRNIQLQEQDLRE